MNIILIQIIILTVLSVCITFLFVRPKKQLETKKMIMTKAFDSEGFVSIVLSFLLIVLSIVILKTEIIENNIFKMFLGAMILFVIALGKK